MKRLFDGFCMAVSMYSILPCPQRWSERAKPLVLPFFVGLGYLVGGIWLGVFHLLKLFGAPMLVQAAVLTATPLIVSGCIHLDGFMDTCDAIFSRQKLEKKRTILKDSHVGAFGATGLCLLLLLEFAAFAGILEAEQTPLYLMWIPVLSRTVSAMTLLIVKPISESGSGAGFAAGTHLAQKIAVFVLGTLGAACMIYVCGAKGAVVTGAELLAGVCAAVFSVKQLEGISGDLCGFIQTMAELGAVVTLSLL